MEHMFLDKKLLNTNLCCNFFLSSFNLFLLFSYFTSRVTTILLNFSLQQDDLLFVFQYQLIDSCHLVDTSVSNNDPNTITRSNNKTLIYRERVQYCSDNRNFAVVVKY